MAGVAAQPHTAAASPVALCSAEGPRGRGGAVVEGGERGPWGPKKFVYQKWPDHTSPTVNFVVSRDGPFGLAGGGVQGGCPEFSLRGGGPMGVGGGGCGGYPRMVTCELSRVGCCLKRRQQQISTCRSQEGGKSLSRAENDPRRLSQKVCGKVVLRVRPNAGERRQHQSHCSYNTRTPQRMTDRQSQRHPPPPSGDPEL